MFQHDALYTPICSFTAPPSCQFLLAYSAEEARRLTSRHTPFIPSRRIFPLPFVIWGKENILQVELVNNTFSKTQSLHPYLTISAPASCREKTQLAKMLAGGLTETTPATPKIQEIANTVSGCSPWKGLIPNLGLGWPCVKCVGEHQNQNVGKCVVLFSFPYNWKVFQMKPLIILTVRVILSKSYLFSEPQFPHL